MKAVYKYVIPDTTDYYYLELPFGSEILYAREQRNQICLWAKVDTSEKYTETRTIRIAGTGHTLDGDDSYIYLGSAHMYDGSLIIHVFEVKF